MMHFQFKRKIMLFFIFSIFSFVGFSQTNTITPLYMGDKVPNVSFGDFMNDSIRSLTLDNLKGKLVILDFWDINCSSCILLMPRLDSLQREFGSKVEIILVTENNKKEVEKLFSHVRIKMPSLKMVINDTLLNSFFPHVTVPHQVWIDTSGVVKFITDAYNATEENISKFLNGEEINLHFKNEIEGFDISKSLLFQKNQGIKYHLKYYSFLMGRLDEFSGCAVLMGQIDSTKETITTRIINSPILELFKHAFGNLIPDGLADIYSNELMNNRMILDVKKPKLFYPPDDDTKKDAWYSQNWFCYESVMPFAKSRNMFSEMQSNLNKYFPYVGKIETRKIKCLILKRIMKNDLISSKAIKEESSNVNDHLKIRNQPLKSSLLRALMYANSSLNTPILDETNYRRNIDIDINAKLTDILQVRRELRKYGLDLVEEEREIKMLVIKDKN